MSVAGKDYLTVGEVSDYLKLPEETIYKYARTGKLPGSKIGRHWRFDRERIDSWINLSSNTEVPLSALVIDDEPMVRDLMTAWLKSAGCNVIAVSGGQQGLSLFNKQKFDVVFLDLMMPSLNGVETFRSLHVVAKHTPVVIVTAFFESHLMEKALEIGPLTIIKKPISKEILFSFVEQLRSSSKLSVNI